MYCKIKKIFQIEGVCVIISPNEINQFLKFVSTSTLTVVGSILFGKMKIL